MVSATADGRVVTTAVATRAEALAGLRRLLGSPAADECVLSALGWG